MVTLAKPYNMAFIVKSSMAKKFLRHTNVDDLAFIKQSANNFKLNQEALHKKK